MSSDQEINYKSQTKLVYNLYPEKFDAKFEANFHNLNTDKADFFIEHLHGKYILDIGSGSGNHARYFSDKGLDVLCGDNSEEMIKLARKKGLKAQLMDIEAIDFPSKTFDGIWAYAVLLHIPKVKIPPIIEQLASILKSDGLMGVSLKEGEGEGFTEDKRYPAAQRWFSYFTDEEAKKLFEPYFMVLREARTPATQTTPFLHYIFRVKK